MRHAVCRQRGFTYLGLIILVAVLGLVGAAGLKLGSLLQRQAAEQALLDIGAQFSDALYSYAAATPPGLPQQPESLAELLRDPRVPQLRRHLRKLFVDPMTGRAEWGLLYQPGSHRIIGVHSLSQATPLKTGNFEARFSGLEGKSTLAEWHFVMAGQPEPREVKPLAHDNPDTVPDGVLFLRLATPVPEKVPSAPLFIPSGN